MVRRLARRLFAGSNYAAFPVVVFDMIGHAVEVALTQYAQFTAAESLAIADSVLSGGGGSAHAGSKCRHADHQCAGPSR